jgi:extracellular elastinolytic metalloproteinase
LIAKHGYAGSLFPPLPLEDGTIPIGDFYRSPETLAAGAAGNLVPKHGNSLMVQLVLNGMKLQQCRPGFFEARDAIIQADQVLTGGENFCDLWIAFAEKGLGVDASVQGRTPWGGGIRKDVRTSSFITPDLTSVNVPFAGLQSPGCMPRRGGS